MRLNTDWLSGLRRLGLSRRRTAKVLRLWARWQVRGMAPMQATEGLADIYLNRAEAVLLKDIAAALNSGRPVTPALRPWLPQATWHRLIASEGRADFAARLERAALDMERQKGGWGDWWIQLGYGLLVVVATAAVMVLVIHREVLPAIESFFATPEQLSGEVRLLRVISSHLAIWWWFWPMGIFFGSAAVAQTAQRWTGRLRRSTEQFPGLRWYRLHLGASLLRATAQLVETGDTWSLAVSRLATGTHGYQRELLLRLQTALGGGQGPAAALQKAGWLSRAAALQLSVLEGDRALPVLAVEIAEEQEAENRQALEMAVRLLQLLLYALAGAGLLLILSVGRALRDVSSVYGN